MKNEDIIRKLKKQYECRIKELKDLIDLERSNHDMKNIQIITLYFQQKQKYEHYLDMIQVVLGEKEIKDLN